MDGDDLEQLIAGARESAFVADHGDAVERLDQALELVDDDGDRGRLLLTRAIVRQGEIDPKLSAEDCRRAYELLRSAGRLGEAALAAAIAAGMQHRLGEMTDSVDFAVEAMVLADGGADGSGDSARAANALAILFAQMCAFRTASELAARAFETAPDPAVREVTAYTASYIVIEAVHNGVEVDIDVAHRASDWMAGSSSSVIARNVLAPGMRAELRLMLGKPADPATLVVPSEFLDATAPRLAAWYRLVQGTAARSVGDHDGALHFLDSALPTLIEVGDHHRVVRAYRERCQSRAARSDLQGALDDALEVARIARSDQVEQVGRLADQIAARAELEMARLALHRRANALAEAVRVDALTGVGSRRWLEDVLDDLSADDGRVAVAMLDLDHFKDVNDAYGHHIGDQVLERFGRVLREAARTEDLVARYGGEEFVAVFPGDGPEVATAYAGRLREALATEPWKEIDEMLEVSVSVGIASGPLDAVRSVLQRADAALYEAKHSGRDRIVTA